MIQRYGRFQTIAQRIDKNFVSTIVKNCLFRIKCDLFMIRDTKHTKHAELNSVSFWICIISFYQWFSIYQSNSTAIWKC